MIGSARAHSRRCEDVRRTANPRGKRHLRPDRGAGGPLLGGADPAQPAELPDRHRDHARAAGACARHRQARGRKGQSRPRRARAARRRRHHARRAGGDRRPAGRTLPAGGLADRLRHPEQHERERGDREPRQRDPGRAARQQGAGPSQRSRQPQPVLERLVPDRDAHRRGRAGPASAAAGARAAARRARGQGRRVPGHHQDRPHPPAGRDALDARPGVLGLRPAGRVRQRPARADAAASLPARAGRHRGRHRPERAAGLRREIRRRGRRDHRPAVRDRGEQVRGAGRARRAGRSCPAR